MNNQAKQFQPLALPETYSQNNYVRLACAAFAVILTYIVSQVVFWDAVLTTDEHAYLMQAYTYIEGQIARALPPLPELFRHEMMIMDEKVGWLSRYPPAHSVWLAAGVLVGSPHLAVSVAAGLSVWIFSGIGRLINLPSVLLAGLMLVSPYFLLMNGTLLSHTSALPASCLLLWAYLAWKITRKNRYAFFAGVAWAWLFLNRTYTGVLVALPFALDALWDLAKNPKRDCFFGTLLFAITSASGGVLYLLYNYLAVGDPTIPTYLFYAPDDGLGFGWRSSSSLPYLHTLDAGLLYLKENLLLLDRWLFGFPGSLLISCALAILGWHKRWSFLCLTVFLSVAIGYVFFWWRGVRDVGPVYYFETLPFILLATAFGIKKLLEKAADKKPSLAVFAALCSLMLAGTSIYFVCIQGKMLRERQRIVGQFHTLIQHAPENSIIMVSGFSGMRHVEKGTSYNPKGINSDPLIIAVGDSGISPQRILERYPNRGLYVMVLRDGQLLLEPFKQ